jgi:hypothetical protein
LSHRPYHSIKTKLRRIQIYGNKARKVGWAYGVSCSACIEKYRGKH